MVYKTDQVSCQGIKTIDAPVLFLEDDTPVLQLRKLFVSTHRDISFQDHILRPAACVTDSVAVVAGWPGCVRSEDRDHGFAVGIPGEEQGVDCHIIVDSVGRKERTALIVEVSPLCRHGDKIHRLGTPEITIALSRSEEHTSELQSRGHLVCPLLLEKKKTRRTNKI